MKPGIQLPSRYPFGPWAFVVPLLVLAFGLGLAIGPASSVATACVSEQQVGEASGIALALIVGRIRPSGRPLTTRYAAAAAGTSHTLPTRPTKPTTDDEGSAEPGT